VSVAVPLGRQLVIFSADSVRPSVADLTGLLVGPGLISRMGGTARVSVRVDAAWRVHALAAEFAQRGLSIAWESTSDGGYWARTSYSSTLVPLTEPSYLDGARLRLWFLANGDLLGDEVVLGLGSNHPLALHNLAPMGLDGEVIEGPAIRIKGEEKCHRLAELIGSRPSSAPDGTWPAAPLPVFETVPAHRERRPRPINGDDEGLLWADLGPLPQESAESA
jgi:hypothetical protein